MIRKEIIYNSFGIDGDESVLTIAQHIRSHDQFRRL